VNLGVVALIGSMVSVGLAIGVIIAVGGLFIIQACLIGFQLLNVGYRILTIEMKAGQSFIVQRHQVPIWLRKSWNICRPLLNVHPIVRGADSYRQFEKPTYVEFDPQAMT
jgi:hypothetical protein